MKKPHARTLHRLAAGLGISVDELFIDPAQLLYRSFDRLTNPMVEEVLENHGELFHGWTQADFDELNSRVGLGGPLTMEGALGGRPAYEPQTRTARKTGRAPGKQPIRSRRRNPRRALRKNRPPAKLASSSAWKWLDESVIIVSMTDPQWLDLLKVIDGDLLDPVPAGLIIDSPWLPGWAGISIMDYFSRRRACGCKPI